MSHRKECGIYSHTSRQKKLKRFKSAGYYAFSLFKNGRRKTTHLHRILAIAFIENPENKAHVNHIDGDKCNNKLENLEWATPKENAQHAQDTGLARCWSKGIFGGEAPSAKPVKQFLRDGTVILWDCASDAVRSRGYDSGSISKACQGKQKTHKGSRWEYA